MYLGNSCRSKVIRTLSKKFKTPVDAEHYYESHSAPSESLSISQIDSQDQVLTSTPLVEPTPGGIARNCRHSLLHLQPEQQLEVLSLLFSEYCSQHPMSLRVSSDFLKVMMCGMKYLNECGRTNVIRSLIQVLGTMRPDGSDSLMPVKRMPMGLIEYCVNFFNSSSLNKVDHFFTWRQKFMLSIL